MSAPTRSAHSRRRLLGLLVGALAALATTLVGITSSSAAAPNSPAPFTNCPVDYVNPTTGAGLNTCIAAVGTGGSFKLGKTVVTLSAGTNLQGGLALGPDGIAFIEATDGMTLSGPSQSVPGGVLGVAEIQNLLPGITNIQAVVELVGTPDFSLGQNIDITLPIQVRLHNALLGAHCVIGSAADPITLHLTTGTTTPPAGVAPISGTPGTVTAPPLGAPVLEFQGQTVVDNAFAVPGASGCGALGALDGVVNAKSGLPAPAGTNNASLITNSFLVAAADVGSVSGYQPGM